MAGGHPPTLQALGVYSLSIVGKTLRGRLAEQLAGRGLTLADVAALAALADLGPCPQRVVADHIRADPADVTRLLESLERRSLVARRRDPDDRRRQVASLTPAGRRTLRASVDLARGIEDDALSALSAAERRHLRSALPKLLLDL
jgi:DNA-binding MarR family transcriptional regulator